MERLRIPLAPNRSPDLHIKFSADYLYAAGGRQTSLGELYCVCMCDMEISNLVKSILIYIMVCIEKLKVDLRFMGCNVELEQLGGAQIIE